MSGTIYCGQLRREKPWEGKSGALSYQVLLHLCPEDVASFSPLSHLFYYFIFGKKAHNLLFFLFTFSATVATISAIWVCRLPFFSALL